MNTVDIRVNVFERLKKIRKGVVYGDITSVIGEFIQNCQRSLNKSTKEDKVIDVVINENTLIIRDNGIGCDDPQTIFEFETSGWGMDHAFGQGGSESVFQIADIFEIYSHDWRVRCNVNLILKTKKLTLKTKKAAYLDGYQLTVRGAFIQQYSQQIRVYLEDILSHLEYNCFINGERVQYVDIQEFKSNNLKVKFDNEMYSATLSAQSASKDTQVFFEKRLVRSIWQDGVFGVIELKDGAVDLKAPDRKDFIWNMKYLNMKNQLTEDTKALYRESVKTFTEEQFERFALQITEFLTPEEYIEYLPDIGLSKQDIIEHGLGLSDKVEPAKTLEKTTGGGIYVEETPAQAEVLETREVVKVNDGFTVVTKEDGKFTDKVKQAINAVWVESSKAQEYKKEIRLAESYGLQVLYAKNRVYEEAYKFLGKVHISEFIVRSEEVYVVTPEVEYEPGHMVSDDRSLISKEDRIMKVLHLIEKSYELGDVFSIASVEKKLVLGEINTKASKTAVAVLKREGKIVLDRDGLALDNFDLDYSYDVITRFDVLVVMANVQAIAGGLSQLMLNTIPDTVEHYNSVNKITKELAILLNNNLR